MRFRKLLGLAPAETTPAQRAAESLSAAAIQRRVRERAEERAEARAAAERREQSAREIREMCAKTGHWWPPRRMWSSRLSAQPRFTDKVAGLFEVWRDTRKGDQR